MESPQMTQAKLCDMIVKSFTVRLVPTAFDGLHEMLVPGADVFCDRRVRRNDGQLELQGTSKRYSAMVLIGLAEQQRLGKSIDMDLGRVRDGLVTWAEEEASLGDAGLVLWALALEGDARAGRVAERIAARKTEVLAPNAPFSTMTMGWLLTGLAEHIQGGHSTDGVSQFTENVCRELINTQNETTSLFPLARPARCRNIFAARRNAHLGSFASQVYPTLALSRYGEVTGSSAALSAARGCADRLCGLQGESGQWWWIYSVHKGWPVVQYPVYSVHQDAMGPMVLLAASRALKTERYNQAILRSLGWMDQHPECPNVELIDSGAGMIWRALQRDHMRDTGPFGLARGDVIRMNIAAWTGRRDRRSFKNGFVSRECRPYHLGWVLLAAAMASGSSASLMSLIDARARKSSISVVLTQPTDVEDIEEQGH